MKPATARTDADLVAVDAAMARLAADLAPLATLRTAPQVLLRARLEARRRATERSLRPLVLWQHFAGAAVLFGMAAALGVAGPLWGGLATAAASAPTPARLLAGVGLTALAALPFAGRGRRLGAS
jgi:hypothetical protein